MKKIIIAAAILLTTGFLALYTPDSSTKTNYVAVQGNVLSDRKDLGSGD
jgi:hypothetical protein